MLITENIGLQIFANILFIKLRQKMENKIKLFRRRTCFILQAKNSDTGHRLDVNSGNVAGVHGFIARVGVEGHAADDGTPAGRSAFAGPENQFAFGFKTR